MARPSQGDGGGMNENEKNIIEGLMGDIRKNTRPFEQTEILEIKFYCKWCKSYQSIRSANADKCGLIDNTYSDSLKCGNDDCRRIVVDILTNQEGYFNVAKVEK